MSKVTRYKLSFSKLIKASPEHTRKFSVACTASPLVLFLRHLMCSVIIWYEFNGLIFGASISAIKLPSCFSVIKKGTLFFFYKRIKKVQWKLHFSRQLNLKYWYFWHWQINKCQKWQQSLQCFFFWNSRFANMWITVRFSGSKTNCRKLNYCEIWVDVKSWSV